MRNLQFIEQVSKVESFIESLTLPKSVASGALRTVEDCHEFYIGFYGRNKYAIDDLLDYREYKIEQSDITLEKFLKMCENGDMIKAFTVTFFQEFSIHDMTFINKAINEGKTSLEKLYKDFKSNPNKNIMKNAL